jgi:hypothetical protein
MLLCPTTMTTIVLLLLVTIPGEASSVRGTSSSSAFAKQRNLYESDLGSKPELPVMDSFWSEGHTGATGETGATGGAWAGGRNEVTEGKAGPEGGWKPKHGADNDGEDGKKANGEGKYPGKAPSWDEASNGLVSSASSTTGAGSEGSGDGSVLAGILGGLAGVAGLAGVVLGARRLRKRRVTEQAKDTTTEMAPRDAETR